MRNLTFAIELKHMSQQTTTTFCGVVSGINTFRRAQFFRLRDDTGEILCYNKSGHGCVLLPDGADGVTMSVTGSPMRTITGELVLCVDGFSLT